MTTKTLQNWGRRVLALMFLMGFAPAAWAQPSPPGDPVREPLVRVPYFEYSRLGGEGCAHQELAASAVWMGSGAVGWSVATPLRG